MWVTSEGKRVLVKAMGDAHIMNTINMLQRRAATIKSYSVNPFAMTHGMSLREILDRKWPVYEHLVAEAKRRGFNIAEEGKLI